MTERGEAVVRQLIEGNVRFRTGNPEIRRYQVEELSDLARSQKPVAAIIACADSRVSPDIIFDQPLGTIFASRVPGNVASDSAKWMLEIALGEFQVPLVMVMGHTGCLAVGQLLDGDKGGAGGSHRYAVLSAVYKARAKNPPDIYRAAVEENAIQTVQQLTNDLRILRKAVQNGETTVVSSVYNMETGAVELLPLPVSMLA